MGLAQVRAGVARSIEALSDSALEYRVGGSGSWIAFVGGILNTDPPVSIGYDDDEGGEVQLQTGLLVAKLSSTALAIGDQVRDHQGQAWAVLGTDRSVAAAMYRLRREPLSDAAYDSARGGQER